MVSPVLFELHGDLLEKVLSWFKRESKPVFRRTVLTLIRGFVQAKNEPGLRTLQSFFTSLSNHIVRSSVRLRDHERVPAGWSHHANRFIMEHFTDARDHEFSMLPATLTGRNFRVEWTTIKKPVDPPLICEGYAIVRSMLLDPHGGSMLAETGMREPSVSADCPLYHPFAVDRVAEFNLSATDRVRRMIHAPRRNDNRGQDALLLEVFYEPRSFRDDGRRVHLYERSSLVAVRLARSRWVCLWAHASRGDADAQARQLVHHFKRINEICDTPHAVVHVDRLLCNKIGLCMLP